MGRSIRMFLVDGTSTGIVTAEIMNWTGHVVTGPRARLADILVREEASRTGVYFLVGEDPEGGGPAVYVGEGDDVGKRLRAHASDERKDFFDRVAVVTSKDQNLTKAHVRFLESHFIQLAQSSGRALVVNSTAPDPIGLPEADVSDMEFFIEQVRLILPVIGLDFLRPKPALRPSPAVNSSSINSAEGQDFFVLEGKRDGVEARAYEADGEFIILAGSVVRGPWIGKSSYQSGYKTHLSRLIERGAIVEEQGRWVTKEDLIFSSLSAAAAIAYGRSSNGRTAWIHEGTGKTYGEFQTAQIDGKS